MGVKLLKMNAMKLKLLLGLAFTLRIALGNVHAAEAYAASNQVQGLVLNIRCPNSVLKLGDEIPIVFVISNVGGADYRYDDHNADSSGWMPEYQMTVKSADGRTIPDLHKNYQEGASEWLGSTRVLHPGESFSKTIPLNLWAMLKTPGIYRVTGVYHGRFGSGPSVESAPISLKVLPRTEMEMDVYISDLTNQLAKLAAIKVAEVNWDLPALRDKLLKRLAFTGSPKIVPSVLNDIYAGDDSSWAAEALIVYVPHTDETRAQIVGRALQHGLAEGMDQVLHAYGCTGEERQAILKRSLAEAPAHLAGSDMAEIYHLNVPNPLVEDRARLAHDFPKFTPQNQYVVLTQLWPRARCPELDEVILALAKPPSKPEQPNDETLGDEFCLRLLETRPEVMRPIILEDLRREKPLFPLGVLRSLPDKELPELDEILAAHLNADQADIWKILPLIERYATDRILPQVVAYYQSRREQGWACSLQTAMIRFWLKHDRPAALPVIEKAVNFRTATGCYHTVLWETLNDSFDADARKLVRQYVNDPDPEVAAEAKRLLALPDLNLKPKQL